MRLVILSILLSGLLLNISDAQVVAMATPPQPLPPAADSVMVSAAEGAIVDPAYPVLHSGHYPTSSMCGCSQCRHGFGHHHGLHCPPDYWGKSSNFCPQPFGHAVNAAITAHIVEGRRSKLVLYRYDFGPEDTDTAGTLNRYGQVKLRKLAPTIASTGWSLMIEPSRNSEELDEDRRTVVIEELARLLGGQVADEQVVVAMPPLRGVTGPESVLPYANRLKRLQNEKVITPAAGSFRPIQ